MSASSKNYELVERLLDKGIGVNSQSKSGKTALMNAVFVGCDSIVKLLLEQKGIDMDLTDKNGKTALDICCFCWSW